MDLHLTRGVDLIEIAASVGNALKKGTHGRRSYSEPVHDCSLPCIEAADA